jgi:hypothetical protein
MKKYTPTIFFLSLLYSPLSLQTAPTTSKKTITSFIKETITPYSILKKEETSPNGTITSSLISKPPIAKYLTLGTIELVATIFLGGTSVFLFNLKGKSWGAAYFFLLNAILIGYSSIKDLYKGGFYWKHRNEFKNRCFSFPEKNKLSLTPLALPSDSSIYTNFALGALKSGAACLWATGLLKGLFSKVKEDVSLKPEEDYIAIPFFLILTSFVGYSGYRDISKGIASWKYRKTHKK